jgi:subtilisin family serine protease
METEKYIILLKNQNSNTTKSVEKEFQIKLTSSELLSSENKSYDVIDDKNGVLYKNLNVMVADKMDEEQLTAAVKDDNNPVLYYEKERLFYAESSLAMVKELQKSMEDIQQKLLALELNMKTKSPKLNPNTLAYEWGMLSIGLNESQLTGKGVDVCIMDTGFDVNHPDFVGRNIEGKSFVEGEAWDVDVKGHGTHCAGIATGNIRSDTGKRYGVAKSANLKIAKVLSHDGSGKTSSIVDAIDWAITKKYRIISMSLSSPVLLNEAPSPIFEMIGQRALDQNCLVIAAAGNDSQRPALPQPVSAPANSQSIMAIGAMDNQNRMAFFSNGGLNASSGGNINLCAPGVDVWSASPVSHGNPLYVLKSGTSMATPHVAGVAALYMERFPHLNAQEIWLLLEKNARKISALKYRDMGNGLLKIIDTL